MTNDFIFPEYNGKNFINIINSIKHNFGINDGITLENKKIKKILLNKEKVVFILVDAFGWKFYKSVREDSKFFKEIRKRGIEEKITSQFPSTTTAHVTSVITGKDVSTHGFFEWFTYDSKINEVFTPFLFDYEGKEEILPKDNLFKELKENGVCSTIITPNYINNSYYSRELFKDGKVKGYDSVEEMFDILLQGIKKDKGKNFYYIYYPKIDSIGHEYGMSSFKAYFEINNFIKALDNFYNNVLDKGVNEGIFILSADHGQMEIKDRIYLNELIPNIEEYMLKDSKGRSIVPVGYNRDMFLYIKKEFETYVYELLKEKFKDKGEIYLVKDLIDKGVFINPSETFLSRMGNIVIIPYDGYGVWWFEKGNYEISLKGSHGGLTKDEMEIPLLIYNF
ncbi:MAG: alkaline phosphatase family protein [Clostridium sp.]|uniref:alkaline phosphatase family protein n=1 Tax=Clostridium sp. TaxID=1506 RepID=UPI0025C1CA0F|nr:alkaline phosphatase family protein [Clostridium sp.]MBS5926594.1 alkaline phosphatase family protein [Clostridium sp.]